MLLSSISDQIMERGRGFECSDVFKITFAHVKENHSKTFFLQSRASKLFTMLFSVFIRVSVFHQCLVPYYCIVLAHQGSERGLHRFFQRLSGRDLWRTDWDHYSEAQQAQHMYVRMTDSKTGRRHAVACSQTLPGNIRGNRGGQFLKRPH